MPELSARDTGVVLDALHEIGGCADGEAFARTAVRALLRLVPADRGSYSELRGPLMRCYIEPGGVLGGQLGEALSRHGHENPILAYYRRTRRPRVSTFSDFVSRSELQRLAVYNEYYRHVEVEHQVITPLMLTTGRGAREIGIALSRRRVDFSTRDRRVLQLLQPHLVQAHDRARAAERLRRHLAFVEGVLDEDGRGAILLGRGAAVRFGSAGSLRLLRQYFPSGEGRSGGLPDELAAWVCREQRAMGEVVTVPAPRRPLVVARDGRELWVRLVSEGERRLLLLEERIASFDPRRLAPLGLTPREADVLAWVAEGKRNDEIGTILGARPATVAKHLERIYRKLGVETRTAAAAQAFAAAGRAAPARP